VIPLDAEKHTETPLMEGTYIGRAGLSREQRGLYSAVNVQCFLITVIVGIFTSPISPKCCVLWIKLLENTIIGTILNLMVPLSP